MTTKLRSKYRKRLRGRILSSLKHQGFELRSGRLVPPSADDKDAIRLLHSDAVIHRIERAKPGLQRHQFLLQQYIASGSDVVPERMYPRLVEVQQNSFDELLFRYARLHWSIPVSAGYGRRLRFLVFDDFNDKLIGLLGLGDPIFSLGPRDRWIGWSTDAKRLRLQCVMELFVLGAIPPYSTLLCGKLIAMLATSKEVQLAFKRKYGDQTSFIRRKPLDKRLALITTTSALGRSSLYNRLQYRSESLFISAGFTQGSGEFQFSNGFYNELREFALANCAATAKHSRWGNGFRNRRELVRKALPLLGLSPDLVYHGIRREIMLAPLAHNTAAFLRGEHNRLLSFGRNVDDLFSWFRERWLLPRAMRDARYLNFESETYKLWTGR